MLYYFLYHNISNLQQNYIDLFLVNLFQQTYIHQQNIIVRQNQNYHLNYYQNLHFHHSLYMVEVANNPLLFQTKTSLHYLKYGNASLQNYIVDNHLAQTNKQVDLNEMHYNQLSTNYQLQTLQQSDIDCLKPKSLLVMLFT